MLWPLALLDSATRAAIEELRGLPEDGVDCDAAAMAWERALRAPGWDGPPVWLHADAREVFRRALDVDDATWTRGHGRALSQALIALPYYRDTNPTMAHNARHVIRAALNER